MPQTVDRISPAFRPDDRTVMYQRWASLLFLHWPVPAEMLLPMLPPGLTLDTFSGRAYVGLIPFTMTGVRPIWFPRFPSLTDFHETNVRTYVHYKGSDPGVWFFSLDAANALAVRVARALWNLPYHYARMGLRTEGEWMDYASERLWPDPMPANLRVRYRSIGPVCPALPDTLEHFLVERYFLYTNKHGHLYRGQVHHAPYPLQTIEAIELDENLLRAAGITRPDIAPLAHYASELNVRIYPLRRVE